MLKISLFLIPFFICSISFCADIPTYELAIYISSYTDMGVENIKGFGYAKDSQPSKLTNYSFESGVKFLRIDISPKTKVEEDAILNGVSSGKVVVLRKKRIITKYDSGLGGNVTYLEIEDVNKDFNFNVKIST